MHKDATVDASKVQGQIHWRLAPRSSLKKIFSPHKHAQHLQTVFQLISFTWSCRRLPRDANWTGEQGVHLDAESALTHPGTSANLCSISQTGYTRACASRFRLLPSSLLVSSRLFSSLLAFPRLSSSLLVSPRVSSLLLVSSLYSSYPHRGIEKQQRFFFQK